MRFDLTVNILTNYAYNKGYIRVFGGKQSRPNCHIDDMCDLYKKLIHDDISKYNGEISKKAFDLGLTWCYRRFSFCDFRYNSHIRAFSGLKELVKLSIS